VAVSLALKLFELRDPGGFALILTFGIRLTFCRTQSRDAIALTLDIEALLLETTRNRCSQLSVFFGQ
jgi:hypothetical protein